MEAKLWRQKRDSLADLYAILLTTQKLEKAYIGDFVSPSDYETECLKLIAQFKTLHSALADSVPSLERFADAHRLDCSLALNRLLHSGVPATIEHRLLHSGVPATIEHRLLHSGVPATIEHRPSAAPFCVVLAADVAECVQNFITAMDSLRLKMFAVDQVHPRLMDLMGSLMKLRMGLLPPDFEGIVKVRDWIGTLSEMQAADELTEVQARQLDFDLDSSYSAFKAAISSAPCV